MLTLGLVGREYEDTILNCGNIILGETNSINQAMKSVGGMFNIPPIEGVTRSYFICGLKKAVIINEEINSSRTSFTYTAHDEYHLDTPKLYNCHWAHIVYVDDICEELVNQLSNDLLIPANLSLDFCKTEDRRQYLPLMKKCKLVFDSRERKELWSDINMPTPVILHDPDGCECYVDGLTTYKFNNKKIENLKVNGAGDIFAAYFIKTYNDSGLKKAVSNACALTTRKLKEINEGK